MGSVAKNSSLYLLSTICIKATSFLLLPFYSYLITPEVYGRVFVANALMAFLTMLMPVALNSSIHRYYFECKSQSEERLLYSTIVWAVTLFVAVFTFAMLLPIGFWAQLFGIPPLYIFISTTSSALQVYYSVITSYLYAKQQAKAISIVSIIVGIVQIVVQLSLVITMEDKALALLVTFMINSIVSFGIFLFFSWRYLYLGFDFVRIKQYLVFGVSQLPSDVSSKVVSLLDRFLLNKLASSAAVGLYGIGYSLASIPTIIFSSINQALVPDVFLEFGKNTTESYKKATDKVGLTFTLITMLFSFLIAFSNHIILVLSDKYKESGTIMCLILFALLIDSYRILFMYPMQYNVKYVKVKSAIWVLAAILSTLLNLLLIPYLSIYGAACSFILSNTLTLLLIFHYSYKAIPLQYNKRYLLFVFFLSAVFSLTVLVGTSLIAFAFKSLFSVVYCCLIYNFSIKKFTNVSLSEIITKKILSHVKFLSCK